VTNPGAGSAPLPFEPDPRLPGDLLIAAGLGLDYGSIRLERTTKAWLSAGIDVRSRVAEILDGDVAGVEVVGSSSVLGLLAKPIIDLAVGLTAEQPLAPVTARLERAGWIYRGDAGNDGGHVFVLEARPWHRVAHIHVVQYDGSQWRNYLRFRDLLRESADARERYEAVKLELAHHDPNDRKSYTIGKTDVVTALIRELDERAH
jgi:GrpB-like predicted nucleotidyltransferase (UPF0157 family)